MGQRVESAALEPLSLWWISCPSRTSREKVAYSSAPRTRSVSHRSPVFQPTIRLENASQAAPNRRAAAS